MCGKFNLTIILINLFEICQLKSNVVYIYWSHLDFKDFCGKDDAYFLSSFRGDSVFAKMNFAIVTGYLLAGTIAYFIFC